MHFFNSLTKHVKKYIKFVSFSTNCKIKNRSEYKKIALLMGYNGQEYSGFQRNKRVKSVENEFLLALLKCNLISQKELDWPNYLGFKRTSRTDKGVSAIHQIISLNLPLVDNLIEKINAELPPTIRVFGYKIVTRHFDCRTFATSRTYTYMIPTFAFCPLEEPTSESFRTTQAITTRINQTLQQYVGVHRYHNFSSGRTAEEPETQRLIQSMECGEPFIQEGLQFYLITVTGQSFIYHQIRKMIGLVICIIRGIMSEDAISRSWESPKRHVPTAPGLGLVLENVEYENYNAHRCREGKLEELLWEEVEGETFKLKQHIRSHIASTEKVEKVTLKWLPELLHYSFEPRPAKSLVIRTTLGKVAFCLEALQEELKNSEIRSSTNLNQNTMKSDEI